MDFIEKFLDEDTKKFRRTLLIDSGNIKDLLARGAVDVFDINWMLADAKDKVKRAKSDLSKMEKRLHKSLLNNEIKKQKSGEKTIKLTKDKIDMKIKSHSEYIRCEEDVMEAEKVYDFLKVKLDAIKERNDLLKELTKYKSNEMYYGTSLRNKGE